MALGGRKPLPQNLADLFGGGGPTEQSADVKIVPDPPKGVLKPSHRLAKQLEAMDYFEFYRDNVGPDHFRPLDVPLLEDLCLARALFDRITEDYMEKETLTQQMVNGLEVSHPLFDKMQKLGERIRKLSVELCLTITERARIKVSGGAEATEKEKKRKELRARYLGSDE